uniref:MAD2L1 binding protein n=1 Tax=Astyanax mexicanus TaxID=7994 RepID=A0A8B9HSK0_ASTMX
MAEGWREEGTCGEIMTPGKNGELCGDCGDRLAPVNRSPDPNQPESCPVSGERCLRAVAPGGLRPGESECCPARAGAVTGDVTDIGGKQNSVKDGINIRLEPVNSEDGITADSSPAGEDHRKTSSADTDLPLSESAPQEDAERRTMSGWQAAGDDEQIARRARDEGQVDVVFPGTVTQDGCCRFVCELLKCVLYQRQQLPMTYDQMVFFQKQQHASIQSEEAAVKKPVKTSGGLNWNKCQRTLQDLDDVLGNLEALFSLSRVPRVLFLLGGSVVLPTELYEVNMEALVSGGGERTLRTLACLRQLFRALFVADLLSDVKPVRLTGTTVMALAHRDCGVAWFKPKVNFRMPTKVKRRLISLSSDVSVSGAANPPAREWDDYIWFQAPVTVKGFCI